MSEDKKVTKLSPEDEKRIIQEKNAAAKAAGKGAEKGEAKK